MRAFLAKVFPLALLMGLTMPLHSAPPHQKPTPQGPLELKIVGPGFIHEGEAVKYKAVLINRSSGPILLAGTPVDGFDAKYDLNDLSPSTLEALRHAVPISVASNENCLDNIVR
jgi:hypothetical protein